jgi:hypothetical protein
LICSPGSPLTIVSADGNAEKQAKPDEDDLDVDDEAAGAAEEIEEDE